MSKYFSQKLSEVTPILSDLKNIIELGRQEIAVTVNATITQLYWNIGKRINQEILQNKRPAYGKQVVATLATQLTK